jgi:serine/threonine protein kinase
MSTPPASLDNLIGPYRLLRKLGEGGMGTVHLAYDAALDRRVAIKVLRQPAAGSRPGSDKIAATQARRFLREARSAARINHPHVVTIYSVGGSADRPSSAAARPDPNAPFSALPYIAMEFVEGGSLSEQLRREGPLHWRAATRAIRDALRGLTAAHARGVIHRDIKPANLLRARDTGDPGGRDAPFCERVKLVDFGLARVVAGPELPDGDLTFPGAFVGSPSYSAPEQVAGAATIDGRADLYALAATWYALLTAQPPFVDDDPVEVMQRHLRDPFPDVRELAPTAPPALISVLDRASRKKPDERFAGAGEMLAAVEALLQLPDDVVPTEPPPARPRPVVPTRSSHATPPEFASDEQALWALESRLAEARARADSSTQLETLRTLYGVYSQLDRRADAQRAFREALVLHVRMSAPAHN